MGQPQDMMALTTKWLNQELQAFEEIVKIQVQELQKPKAQDQACKSFVKSVKPPYLKNPRLMGVLQFFLRQKLAMESQFK